MTKGKSEQIRTRIKNMSINFQAAKANLVKDEKETRRWKDDLYYQALDCFQRSELGEKEGIGNINKEANLCKR